MAYILNLMDWRSLTDLVNKQISPNTWIYDLVFGSVRRHTTRKIDFEKYATSYKMARFKQPGKSNYRLERKTKKIINIPNLPETGEDVFYGLDQIPGGNHSLTQSIYNPTEQMQLEERNMLLAQDAQDMRDRLSRLKEWMACKALQGKIEYRNGEYEADFDFGYVEDEHLITLESNDQWGATNGKISEKIRSYKRTIMRRTGQPANTCILGSEAAEVLLNDKPIMEKLHNQNYPIGKLDQTQKDEIGGTFLGRIHNVDFWEYDQEYEDDDGNKQNYIDPKNAIFLRTSPTAFRRHLGPVWRMDRMTKQPFLSNNEFLAHVYPVEEPDGHKQEVASCFLPAVHDVDHVLCIKVKS